MKKSVLFFVLFIFLISLKSFAQYPYSLNAGPDTTIACGTSCFNYKVSVPDIRTTEDYTVKSVPYLPKAFITTGPALTISCANQDDKFFDVSRLGFRFCFYGRSYDSVVASTNGLVSFDLSNVLDCSQWNLDGASNVPFTGTGSQCNGTCQTPSGILFPRASILGPYHDIYIDNGVALNKKIEFRVEGVAPFRYAVISFSAIPMFSCTTMLATHEIVIYESTGIVEVYIKDKPLCTGWNDGLAIVGIQNWERNRGLAAPGRSLGAWGGMNMREGWRFTPNGSSPLIDHVDLLLNGAVVGTGTIGATTNGMVDIDFGNVCPPSPTNTYTVKAFYKACNDVPNLFSLSDSLIVSKNQSDSVFATITDAACAAGSTGTITITSPVGANYTYSIDGGTTFQATTGFVKVPGIYPVIAKNNTNGCTFVKSFRINSNTTLTAVADSFKTACVGSATGKIVVHASLEISPYSYSLDNNPVFQLSDTFKNVLGGSHIISVKDAANCVYSFPITVLNGIGITTSATSTNAGCSGSASGTITIDPPTTGLAPYTYIKNSISNGTNNVFTGLLGGTSYPIAVTDANGCIWNKQQDVNNSPGITLTHRTVDAACNGIATGKIIVTTTSGRAPFTYAVDGNTPQLSDTIKNLAGGANHTVIVTDANGCSYTFVDSVINGFGPTAFPSTINAACTGVANGTIIFIPGFLSTLPLVCSIDSGANFFPIDTFRNRAAGTYQLAVRDPAGCKYYFTGTVRNNIGVTATTATIKSACAGAATGKIIVKTLTGTRPFKYSINGGSSFQLSDTIKNLPSNTYSVLIVDANTCSITVSATVGDSTGVTATTSTIKSACAAAATGKIIVRPILGTRPFKYSLNGGTPQLNDTFPNLAANTYNVTIIDSNNCSTTITATVSDSTGATATARTLKSACATASTGKIIVVPGIGTSPFRYALGSGPYQTNDTFPNLAANTYRVNILDANNCPFSFDTTVVNLPVVLPSVRPLNSACSGAATGTLIITPNVGTGISPFQYSLDNGATFPFTDTIRNLAANTYNLAVKDFNNCVVNFTGVVSNNPGVSVNTVIDKASCAIVPNGKITVNPSAGIPPFSYSLGSAGPQSSNQFANLFSGPFTVTITDSALCSTTINVVVGNAARVVVDSIRVIRPTCKGFTNGTIAVYPRLGVPPYKYAINSGAYQTSNSFANIAASTVSDTLHIMDNSGCVKDTIIIITEPNVLTIATASVPATCTGNPDGKITVSGGGGTIPYLYTMDAAVVNGFKTDPEFFLVNGKYTFGIRDSKGCIIAKVDSVLLLDTMRLELGADITLCAESSIVLEPQTNAQTNIFKWWPKAGLTDSLVKNPSASPKDTTKYYVRAKWGICERMDSITVKILLRPVPNAGNDTAVCYQTSGVLYGTTGKVSGPVSYSWSPSTFLSRTDTTFAEVTADTSGIYPYLLTVKDNYGCNFSTTDLVIFTMLPIPVAFAGNDTTAVLGMPHQLLGTGGATYKWSWDAPSSPVLTSEYIANPLAIIKQETIFRLEVKDIAGCPDTASVKVTPYVGPACYIPSAFSPDGGSAANSVLRPTQVGMKSLEHFKIYNRYGQPVFESSNWSNGWDGTYKGQRQSAGAYVWTLRCTGRTGYVYDLKGTVMLIR